LIPYNSPPSDIYKKYAFLVCLHSLKIAKGKTHQIDKMGFALLGLAYLNLCGGFNYPAVHDSKNRLEQYCPIKTSIIRRVNILCMKINPAHCLKL